MLWDRKDASSVLLMVHKASCMCTGLWLDNILFSLFFIALKLLSVIYLHSVLYWRGSFFIFSFINKVLEWWPLIIWMPSSFLSPPDLSEQQWGGIVLNEGWDDFTDCLSWKMIPLESLTLLCWTVAPEWSRIQGEALVNDVRVCVV